MSKINELQYFEQSIHFSLKRIDRKREVKKQCYVPGFMTDVLNEIKKLSLHVLLICYMHIYVCFNAMISKVIFISGILDCKRHV